MPNDGDRYWFDALKSRRSTVRRIEEPRTLNEAAQAVRRAIDDGHRVRADAAGHSFSDVAVPDGVLVDPKHLDGIDQTGPRKVKVQTGVRIRDLVRFLNDRDLALANLGSYDLQTLPGATSTGTHGSGIELGGLPDLVRSIELVDGTGTRRTLAPSDGDAFLAATCSLGALGLILSMELKVEPTYDLSETAELTSWAEVRGGLRDGSLLTEARCVEVMISPYHHTPGSGPYRGQRIRPVLVLKRASTTGQRRGGHRPLLPMIGLLFGGITADVVLGAVRNDPLALEGMHYDSCALSADDHYVDRWDKSLLQDLSNVPASSLEVGVPVNRTVEACELLFEQIRAHRAAGLWHTSPLNLRFVAPSSRSLVAMYTERATTMIEIPQLLGTPGMDTMYAACEELLISRVEGRPHWGKVHQLVGSRFPLAQVHPQWPRFAAVRQTLDPDDRFGNAMTDRIGA